MGKRIGVTMGGPALAALIAALALGAGAASAAAAEAGKPDRALLAKAEQARPDALKLLERLVNIDSGTFNGAGLDRVGAIAQEELQRLGAKVETFPATPSMSRNIQATLTGTGKGRILLVAHMDTVFPDGAAAARPFRIEGTRAYGPGIMDDKGGIVVALAALKVLKQSGDTGYAKITLLLNTNEETGSQGTRALMDKLAHEHDVALNLEPGRPADGLVVVRKGSGEIELEVSGKAAHAGVAPDAGRNAAMEAAHQVLQLSRLADAAKQTTVNFTVIKAGERTNVIPDRAIAQADVRVAVPEEFDRVEQDLARISATHLIPDTTVSARLRRGFPPMPKSPVTDAVAAKAQAVYGELGRKLTLESSGGAADSSLTFATGVPTIDGLGIVGGGIHTPEEYAEVESIAPRVYLLARLIQEYGR
jgi:glutamate carboxypeptidase